VTNEEEEHAAELAYFCYECVNTCEKIENMEENGYIDATEFIECQMIYDPEDSIPLYAGPICASGGQKIKIGVFLDEYCTRLSPYADVDDYLMDNDGYMMKLSHALLKQTYATYVSTSCLPDDDDNDVFRRRLEEPDVVQPFCRTLYEDSAPAPGYFVANSTTGFMNDTSLVLLRARADVEATRGSDGATLPTPEVRLVWSNEEGLSPEDDESYWGDEGEDRPLDQAFVRISFGPSGQGDGTWTLTDSTLLTSDGVGELVPGGGGIVSGIGLEGAGMFHCEVVEFNYVSEDDGDPGSGGTVRLRDVLLVSFDPQLEIPEFFNEECSAAIYNPCAEQEGKICHAVNGEIGCVNVDYDRESVVPGLSREEYLQAFVCEEAGSGGSDYNGGGTPPTPPPYVPPEDDWEPIPPQMLEDWDKYSVRPMKCVIENNQEKIMFSVYRNSPYYRYTPCDSKPVGTYTAPLSVFVNITHTSQFERRERSLDNKEPMNLECTLVQEDWAGATELEERWVRVGCSEVSQEGMFLNSYADNECTQDRITVDIAAFQINFRTCHSCGLSRLPMYEYEDDLYAGDDAAWEEAYEEGHAHENDNSNYNYNGNQQWGRSDLPSLQQCSDLHIYLENTCDPWCQDALSYAANKTADLYWEGHRAFLQASNVTAVANGSTYRFEDNFHRPESIESGGRGEEISREGWSWIESSQERRLKFYFQPAGNGFDQGGAIDWFLYEARMYAYDGANVDWIYWSNRESQIRVPAGKHLFFCDYVEFNFTAGNFIGHDVYIGGFLPFGYDVCSLSIHNPCQNDDGTRSLCRAIDGIITCSDLATDTDMSSSPPLTARVSPSGSGNELLCEKPLPGADPVTLDWRGTRSFLYANKASAGYMDGSAFRFEDREGREPQVMSGSVGERLYRQGWRDADNFMERTMTMSFSPSSRSPLGNELEDAALFGWKMNFTSISGYGFLDPAPLLAMNEMIRVPPGKNVFHCDYVEFRFSDYSYEYYEDDDFYDVNGGRYSAVFAGHDVVIGAYLAEGHDVCSLEVYNPCREEGAVGPMCHAVDGQISCVDTAVDLTAVGSMRSGTTTAVLSICDEDSQPLSESNTTDPALGVPTVAPTEEPADDMLADVLSDSSSVPRALRALLFGRWLLGILSFQFIAQSLW